jgi:hypothetical protein
VMQVDERVAAVRLSKLWLMKREKGVASQTRQGGISRSSITCFAK